MRYSQMTPEQRQYILEDPRNYPLRVEFLGKRAILSYEEVAFLRSHGVDFDVDDEQIAALIVEEGQPDFLTATVAKERIPERKVEAGLEPRGHIALPSIGCIGCLIGAVTAMLAMISLLRRALRLSGVGRSER